MADDSQQLTPTNPNADSDYLQTAQHRADVATATSFINQYEGSTDQEKAKMLTVNNMNTSQYRKMKTAIGMPLTDEEEKAERPTEAVGAQEKKEAGSGQVIGYQGDFQKDIKGLMEKYLGPGGDLSEQASHLIADSIKAAPYLATALGLAGSGAEAGTEAAVAGGEAGTAAEAAPEAAAVEGAQAPAQAAAVPATTEAAARPVTPEVSPEQTAAEAGHTDEQMLAAAKARPMTKQEVQAIELTSNHPHATPKTPVDADTMLRLHNYTADRANEAITLLKQAKATGDPDIAAKAEEARQDVAEMSGPRLKAVWHQAGLTLQKAGASDPANQQLRDVMDLLSQGNMDSDRLARAMAAMPSAEQRQMLLDRAAQTSDWTAKGALYKLYVNSILSFNSVGKKAASDMANIIWQIPARAIGETFTQITGRGGIAPEETAAMSEAMTSGFGRNLNYALDSAAKGQPMFESDVGFLDNDVTSSLMGGSGYENTWWGKGVDYIGHLFSLPARGIMAIDQFAKATQYDMELAALGQREGYNQAMEEGLTGAELSTRARELAQGYYEKPLDWMTDKAMTTAKTNTFQADLEGSLAKADALRTSNYATRTLLPFFKTPVNITLQGIRQSPLAPLSPTWRATMAGGGPDAVLAGTKAAMGTAVLAYLTKHVLEGRITGGIPPNLPPSLKDEWLKNNQPYSIKLGDKWHSYNGLEPLSWLLGVTADAAPMFAYLKQGEGDQAVGALVSAALHEFSRQEMWGAIHTISSAIDDAEKGRVAKISEFFGRLGGAVVPSTVANFAGYTDPVRRQTHSALDELRNRVPYLRENGLSTLDPFGKPDIIPPGFMFNEFPAYKTVEQTKDDHVAKEMLRLHYATGFAPPNIPKAIGGKAENEDDLSAPPETAYGATLSDEEQHRWQELRGDPGHGLPTLYDSVDDLMNSDRYKAASDTVQSNMVHGQFMMYQKASEGEFIRERGLQDRIAAAFQNRRQLYQGRKVTASAGGLGTP